MYIVTTAAMIRNRVLVSEALNASAAPWKLVKTLAGKPRSVLAFSMAFTASPSEEPGARLKEMVAAGNWAAWLIDSAARRSLTAATAVSRTCAPVFEVT